VFTEDLLSEALARHSLKPADRRLTQELVFGVVRWQATLDWLIARKTTRQAQQAMVQILLRLGLYQMFWLDRIPNYASVNETVGLTRHFGFGPQAGFVNALLRAYGRDSESTQRILQELKGEQPWLGYSHPEWLYRRWHDRWGAAAVERLLAWNNGPASTFARINTLRTSTPDLLQAWDREQVKYLPRSWPWTGQGLLFELLEHPPLESLASFQQGAFYVQDPSTVLAVTLLDPQKGECILDACSAPGGKTTLIAQWIQNQGRVVAEDTSADRLERVQENVRRLGATCIHSQLASQDQEPTHPTLEVHPLYDRILADVPCSNTGVMRRRVDLRWRVQPDEIERLARAQEGILRRAARRLKPGGTLVYSTCSLEPEENEAVVERFLAEHPFFKCDERCFLSPFSQDVDGAYAARLRRHSNDVDR
jgi:16S rRNA (cytosine967-C5)-methyltransferase